MTSDKCFANIRVLNEHSVFAKRLNCESFDPKYDALRLETFEPRARAFLLDRISIRRLGFFVDGYAWFSRWVNDN